jgi:hypothetical protein
MLSAHADVFDVDITVMVGSIPITPCCATTSCFEPSFPVEICGVESGKSAIPLGGPPAVEPHIFVFSG